MTVSNVYDAAYVGPANFPRAFAAVGQGPIIADRARTEISLPQTTRTFIGRKPSAAAPVAGWALSVHHQFDPVSRSLFMGDGTRRTAASVGRVVYAVAGGGTEPAETAGSALAAALHRPRPVAIANDGTLYLRERSRLLRVTPSGTLSVLGELEGASTGGSALDRNGALFYTTAESVAEPEGWRVRVFRFNATADDVVVATIELPLGQDFEPAFAQIATGSDGTFYVGARRSIFRVDPSGGTQLIAELEPLENACGVRQLAVSARGDVYIVRCQNSYFIDRMTPDGRVVRVAGGPDLPGQQGDGGPATAAGFIIIDGLAVMRGGAVAAIDGLFFEGSPSLVRQISTDGFIASIAGGGVTPFGVRVPDGSPALGTLRQISGLLNGPDGSLYTADAGHVYRLAPRFGSSPDSSVRIPSEDGRELFEFTPAGRHLRTLDTLTGAVVYTFEYDGQGRLVRVRDGDGLVTEIERHAGAPAAIVALFGQRTTLAVDGNGSLSSVTAPGGRTTALTSTPGGLLTRLVDANGHPHEFAYDAQGRLLRDDDPAGGAQVLARS